MRGVGSMFLWLALVALAFAVVAIVMRQTHQPGW